MEQSVANTQRWRAHNALKKMHQYGMSQQHIEAFLNENGSKMVAYHNTQHLFVVALHAERLATAAKFPLAARQALFYAGLYHDYNHSGSHLVPDSENIDRAVIAMRNDLSRFNVRDVSPAVLERLIRGTEHGAEVTTEAERILQEADFAYVLEEDVDDWIARLSVELRERITRESTLAFIKGMDFQYLEAHLYVLSKGRVQLFGKK